MKILVWISIACCVLHFLHCCCHLGNFVYLKSVEHCNISFLLVCPSTGSKMAQFEFEEFLETKVTRVRLNKLDKLKLWQLMQFLELEAPEDCSKACTEYPD